MLIRRLALPLTIIALILAGCAKPPTQEINTAKASIKKARDAEAQKFAKPELASAESFLVQAEQDTKAGSYDQARDKALRADEQAKLALQTAQKNKDIWLENEKKREAELKAAEEAAAKAAAEEAAAEEEPEDLFAMEEENLFGAEEEPTPAPEETAPSEEGAPVEESTLPEESPVMEATPEPTPAVIEEEEEVLDLEEPAAAPVSSGGGTVVVEPGDTLWSIAADPVRGYGDRALWPLIWDANRDKLSDPDRIRSGMTLVVPANVSEAEKEEARKRAADREGYDLFDQE